jgi:hypothetical protein
LGMSLNAGLGVRQFDLFRWTHWPGCAWR